MSEFWIRLIFAIVFMFFGVYVFFKKDKHDPDHYIPPVSDADDVLNPFAWIGDFLVQKVFSLTPNWVWGLLLFLLGAYAIVSYYVDFKSLF